MNQELITNYTNYVNKNESIEEIQTFMVSIDDAVNEVLETMTISNITKEVTDYIARVQFNQTYNGLDSLLNSTQKDEFENYFESLTQNYTYKNIVGNFTITNQEIFTDGNGNSSRRLGTPRRLITQFLADYKCVACLGISCRILDQDIGINSTDDFGKELIGNFTDYMHDVSTTKETKNYMNAELELEDAVEEVEKVKFIKAHYAVILLESIKIITVSSNPSYLPTSMPSSKPSNMPSDSNFPSARSKQSVMTSANPSEKPSIAPSRTHSLWPSNSPTSAPSSQPSLTHSLNPSAKPSIMLSTIPSLSPSIVLSGRPPSSPSQRPSNSQLQVLLANHLYLLRFSLRLNHLSCYL